MYRIPPKPRPDQIPFSSNGIKLLVQECRQSIGLHRLQQIQERFKQLFLTSPSIELDKLSVNYHHAFKEELLPRAFGFLDVMEMLKSLHEVQDVRTRVPAVLKLATLKEVRSTGCPNLEEDGDTDKQGSNQLLENIFRLLEKYPNGLYLEDINTGYEATYEEELAPCTFGFPNMEMMMQEALNDFVEIKQIKREELKWILRSHCIKNVGSPDNNNSKISPLHESNKADNKSIPDSKPKENISNGSSYRRLNAETKNRPGSKPRENISNGNSYRKINYANNMSSPDSKPKDESCNGSSYREPDKIISTNLPLTKPLRAVVETLRTIISNMGGIEVNDLISEYQARTGKRLDIQELGFLSLPDFLAQMGELFKTTERNGKVVLVDPEINLGTEESHSMEAEIVVMSDTKATTEETNTPSASKVLMNLNQLLNEEFPGGLRIDELKDAYETLYGASKDDLQPEKHGYSSLETFLNKQPNFVTLLKHQDTTYVLPSQPFTTPKPDQLEPLCPGRVAGKGDRFSMVGVLPQGLKLDVMGGEVYSPHLFCVILRGHNNSIKLDILMDQMLAFYSSCLGERYKVEEGRVTCQMPVAALYKADDSYYRAIVLSVDDQTTYTVYFVDYGTIYVTTLDCLRYLHKRFFMFPAQAIKCKLYGMMPFAGGDDGAGGWSLKACKRFLVLVQNMPLKARVEDAQSTPQIKLWYVSGHKKINIGELLLTEGLAALDDSLKKHSKPRRPEVSATSSKVPANIISLKDLEEHLYPTSQKEPQDDHSAARPSLKEPKDKHITSLTSNKCQVKRVTSPASHKKPQDTQVTSTSRKKPQDKQVKSPASHKKPQDKQVTSTSHKKPQDKQVTSPASHKKPQDKHVTSPTSHKEPLSERVTSPLLRKDCLDSHLKFQTWPSSGKISVALLLDGRENSQTYYKEETSTEVKNLSPDADKQVHRHKSVVPPQHQDCNGISLGTSYRERHANEKTQIKNQFIPSTFQESLEGFSIGPLTQTIRESKSQDWDCATSFPQQAVRGVTSRTSKCAQTSSEAPFGTITKALPTSMNMNGAMTAEKEKFIAEAYEYVTEEADTTTKDVDADSSTSSHSSVQGNNVRSTERLFTMENWHCVKKEETTNTIQLSGEKISSVRYYDVRAALTHTLEVSRPMDSSLSFRVRAVGIAGVLYVLDVDLPLVHHDNVQHLAVNLLKGTNQDVYLSLAESGFDIMDYNGKFRNSIVMYPFPHLPAILAHSGYNMIDYRHTRQPDVRSTHPNTASDMLLPDNNMGSPVSPSVRARRCSSVHSGGVECGALCRDSMGRADSPRWRHLFNQCLDHSH